jgi:hypothetical protein
MLPVSQVLHYVPEKISQFLSCHSRPPHRILYVAGAATAASCCFDVALLFPQTDQSTKHMSTSTVPPAMNPLSFIDRIIADLELTPTQYEQAKTSYEAVAEALRRPASPILIFNPSIHPQGSMRIGTTKKPWRRDHFDLDMLCWLGASGKQYTPHDIYERVYQALKSHGTYCTMLERRCRCIRINYNETFQFHLDVTPAIPDWDSQSDALYIPDRTLKTWCPTHPLAFADTFFKPIAAIAPLLEYQLTANSRQFSAKAASIEPLPAHGAFDKKPLQRIVQLLKHDRDKYYENRQGLVPSSILLTTITAHSYSRAVRTGFPSLIHFVRKVVGDIPIFIERSHDGTRMRYRVANPVHTTENFAERWTDQHYVEFMQWHSQLAAYLNSLEDSRGKGVDVMLNALSARYGEDSIKRAANSLGVDTRILHEAGLLRMSPSTGAVGAVGSMIPRTVNFGHAEG